MTYIYNETDYRKAKARRDKLLIIYFAILAAAAGLNVLMFIFRNDWGRGLMQGLNIVLTLLLGCFTLYYFSVMFKPVKSYYKFLANYQKGVSEQYRGKFLRFEDEPQTKYGLIFYSLVTEEKVIKRQDFPERRILIEIGLPRPDFVIGRQIRYITYAGILVAYEAE